jgi:hypothetical protein
MLEDPESSVNDLSRSCGIKPFLVSRCKKQILEAAKDLTTLQPIYFRKVEPIHLTNAA